MFNLYKQQMRYFVLFLIIISLNSCIVFDKVPELRVTIDKTLIADIDSIFLIDNSQYADLKERNSIKVTSEINDYSFYGHRSNARIRI